MRTARRKLRPIALGAPGADLPRFCSRFFMFEINQRVLEGRHFQRGTISRGSNFSRQIHEGPGVREFPFHFVTQYNRFGQFPFIGLPLLPALPLQCQIGVFFT